MPTQSLSTPVVLGMQFPKQKHHITREFVKHVDSWTRIKTPESDVLTDGTSGQCFNSPLGDSEVCSQLTTALQIWAMLWGT